LSPFFGEIFLFSSPWLVFLLSPSRLESVHCIAKEVKPFYRHPLTFFSSLRVSMLWGFFGVVLLLVPRFCSTLFLPSPEAFLRPGPPHGYDLLFLLIVAGFAVPLEATVMIVIYGNVSAFFSFFFLFRLSTFVISRKSLRWGVARLPECSFSNMSEPSLHPYMGDCLLFDVPLPLSSFDSLHLPAALAPFPLKDHYPQVSHAPFLPVRSTPFFAPGHSSASTRLKNPYDSLLSGLV